MYDCQRRFLYLIIIIYLIIYIGARVIYISARRGAGTCTDATMRARDARAAGRPAAIRTRRAEGLSGANTAKNKEAVWVFQILCLPLPDAEEAPAPANVISKSVEVPTAAVRQLCRRLGLCTMVAGTMHQVAGTMHQVAGTMHHGHRDYAPGHWDYATWSLGLCTRSPGLCTRSPGLCARSPEARTKDKRYI